MSARVELRVGALALAAALAPACGDDGPGAPVDEVDPIALEEGADVAGEGRFREWRSPFGPEGDEPSSAADLEAIGYSGSSTESADEAPAGVVRHAVGRAGTGLNFYTSGHAPEAVLMDMDGEVLHTWRRPFAETWPGRTDDHAHPQAGFWRRAALLADGDVLAIHAGLGLVRLDVDSNVEWASDLPVHHDLEVLPNGEIWVLGRRARVNSELHPDKPVLEDFLLRLSPAGEPLDRIALADAYLDSPHREVLVERPRPNGNIFHTNTLAVLDDTLDGVVPGFEAGNLLLCSLTLRAFAVVDPGARRVVWSYRHEYGNAHDPQLLPDGGVLFLRNGSRTTGSSLRVFDPATREETWASESSAAHPWWTETCGTVRRFGNGNTLVTESDRGRAFELDADGEVVWDFRSPHRAGARVATLFDVVRVAPGSLGDWAER